MNYMPPVTVGATFTMFKRDTRVQVLYRDRDRIVVDRIKLQGHAQPYSMRAMWDPVKNELFIGSWKSADGRSGDVACAYNAETGVIRGLWYWNGTDASKDNFEIELDE